MIESCRALVEQEAVKIARRARQPMFATVHCMPLLHHRKALHIEHAQLATAHIGLHFARGQQADALSLIHI